MRKRQLPEHALDFDITRQADLFGPLQPGVRLVQRGHGFVKRGDPRLRRAYQDLGITNHDRTTGVGFVMLETPVRALTAAGPDKQMAELIDREDINSFLVEAELFEAWRPFLSTFIDPENLWNPGKGALLQTYDEVAAFEDAEGIARWHCAHCHTGLSDFEGHDSDWVMRRRVAWYAWAHRDDGQCIPRSKSLSPLPVVDGRCLDCEEIDTLPDASPNRHTG